MNRARVGGHLLEKVSLLYVFLPCCLFVLGWLKWFVAVPSFVAISLGVYCAFHKLTETSPGDESTEPAPEPGGWWRILNHVATIALVLFVVTYSGVGGYAHQVPDYVKKHNTFMKDLMESSWPLCYAQVGDSAHGPLVTYFAYYLPHAAVGKLLGWQAANLSSLLWTYLGVYLCVLWFLRILKTCSAKYTLLFLFFGGLDIIGWFMLHKYFFMINRHLTMDFWLGHAAWADPTLHAAAGDCRWYYFSNMALLYQAVHHLLPGGIVVLMTIDQAMRRRSAENVAFLWSALPTGSVLVALGMIPLSFVSVLVARGRNLFTFQNLVAAPILALISFLFFQSNNADYPHGWLWKTQSMTTAWIVLLIFFFIEFGVYLAVCPPRLANPGSRPTRIWLWTAVGTMVLFSLYRLGVYNDLAAKAAIPSLLVVQLYIAGTIRNATTDSEKHWARFLVFLLVIGSCSALNELSRAFEKPVKPVPADFEGIPPVTEFPEQGVAAQLFGDTNAFFWKYLAKPVEYY